jgi:hypothetical protein
MPQQMRRLVDTRHKMARLSVVSSDVARLSRPSSRGATSTAVHASRWRDSVIVAHVVPHQSF